VSIIFSARGIYGPKYEKSAEFKKTVGTETPGEAVREKVTGEVAREDEFAAGKRVKVGGGKQMPDEVKITASALTITPQGKKVWIRRFAPEEATFVEDGIRPLVVALNQWEKIETIASCEGHPDHEKYDVPYVSFYCNQRGLVKMLKERIKGTEWHIFVNDYTIPDPKAEYKIYTIRPNLRGRLAFAIEEIAEVVKREDFNPEDIESKVNTFILEEKLKKGGK
jgi:hypothetical protein